MKNNRNTKNAGGRRPPAPFVGAAEGRPSILLHFVVAAVVVAAVIAAVVAVVASVVAVVVAAVAAAVGFASLFALAGTASSAGLSLPLGTSAPCVSAAADAAAGPIGLWTYGRGPRLLTSSSWAVSVEDLCYELLFVESLGFHFSKRRFCENMLIVFSIVDFPPSGLY